MMDEAQFITQRADVFLIIGTSLNVYPAAGLVQQNGASAVNGQSGNRRPGTPNGSGTPGPPEQQLANGAQQPFPVFPAAYFDPTGSGMVRMASNPAANPGAAAAAAAAAAMQGGIRLMAPGAQAGPLLMANGQGAAAGAGAPNSFNLTQQNSLGFGGTGSIPSPSISLSGKEIQTKMLDVSILTKDFF